MIIWRDYWLTSQIGNFALRDIFAHLQGVSIFLSLITASSAYILQIGTSRVISFYLQVCLPIIASAET